MTHHTLTVLTMHGTRNLYLVCACGRKAHLGIAPTVEHVLDVSNDHLAGAKARPEPRSTTAP